MPFQDSYQMRLHTLAKWVGMDHMPPTEVVVPLPGASPDDKIAITTFDFISQMHSFLSDKELNTTEPLVNAIHTFACYDPPNRLLGECLCGSWYHHAWSHMETSMACKFMIPIMFKVDKTRCQFQENSVCFQCSQMSLSIFICCILHAWHPLGFIANEDYFFSPAERQS